MTLFAEISRQFETPEASNYYGEKVTIAEHMLQAASKADDADAPPALVVAALLHDVGHLVEGHSADDRNRNHAQLAMEFLTANFGADVSEPVRLHVDAKRYLVAIDPEYQQQLSPASVHTLKLQGGPMTADECSAFESNPAFDDAVRLRHWDEQAKDPNGSPKPLPHFKPFIEVAKLGGVI